MAFPKSSSITTRTYKIFRSYRNTTTLVFCKEKKAPRWSVKEKSTCSKSQQSWIYTTRSLDTLAPIATRNSHDSASQEHWMCHYYISTNIQKVVFIQLLHCAGGYQVCPKHSSSLTSLTTTRKLEYFSKKSKTQVRQN